MEEKEKKIKDKYIFISYKHIVKEQENSTTDPNVNNPKTNKTPNKKISKKEKAKLDAEVEKEWIKSAEKESLVIINQLKKDGYRLWFDKNIIAGEEWRKSINKHIEKCNIFLSLITDNYLKSSFCIEEYKYAQEKGKEKISIVIDKQSDNIIQDIEYQKGKEKECYIKLYENKYIKACKIHFKRNLLLLCLSIVLFGIISFMMLGYTINNYCPINSMEFNLFKTINITFIVFFVLSIILTFLYIYRFENIREVEK